MRLFSDCSVSCAMMMAVEDMATAPPMTIAAVGAIPNSANAPAPTSAVVTSTWAPPTPSTSQRIATRRGRENSEPEREHQEHHAEIREQARRVVVHRPGEGVRTEQHADREIADDRGQCELARAGDDADRGGEQDQDLEQRAAVHSRCPTDCGAC